MGLVRFVRILVVVLIAAAQAGCAGTLVPDLAAAPVAPPPAADLDSIAYGRGPVVVPGPVPAVIPAEALAPPPISRKFAGSPP